MVNRTRQGKPDHCPKQLQVGCKCKLALKLLQPLKRCNAVKMTSKKLAIVREQRKHNPERQQEREAMRRGLQLRKLTLKF
ncbi:hypothetical protein BHE74_00008467 [Ensete ventricosum]|nr:hypothetical protein GW17_00037325 [Ensete ventricosum]RWW83041.1 hypothetical protein BHE74_00008467 [Ensete ventricosum]RZR90380.1 hypothetical protein BHM03_00018271 [Ensete ventricosum]